VNTEKIGVFAKETSFPNFRKVKGPVEALCENLDEKIHQMTVVLKFKSSLAEGILD